MANKDSLIGGWAIVQIGNDKIWMNLDIARIADVHHVSGGF